MLYNVKDLEELHGITWEELVELEPGLERLASEIERVRPQEGDEGFNYEGVWGRFKQPISDQVGHYRKGGDPKLKTHGAYEVAYRKLWHVLHS